MTAEQKNEILSRIVGIICGTEPIYERLERVAVYLCDCKIAPVIAFYLLHRRGRRLVLRLAADASGPRKIPAPAPTYRIPHPDEELCQPLITHLPQRLKACPATTNDDLRREFPAGWSIPMSDSARIYGVMALFARRDIELDEDAVCFLQVIGSQLTLGLRCALVKERDQIIVNQLKYLHRLGAWLNAESDLEKIFTKLPDSTPLFFANSLSRLEVFSTADSPALIYTHGSSDPEQLQLLSALSRLHDHRQLRTPKLIDRRRPEADNSLYQRFFEDFLLHIILPLPGRKDNLGTLEFFLFNNLYSRELLPIQDEELALLEILALHIAATITRTHTRGRLEAATRESQRRNQQLMLLHQVKNALLAADTPETIIHLTLGTLADSNFFACSPAFCLELNHETEPAAIFYAETPTQPKLPKENPTFDEPDISVPEMTQRLLASVRKPPEDLQSLLKTLHQNLPDNAPPRLRQALANGRPTLLPAAALTAIDSRFKQLFGDERIILIPLYEQGRISHLGLAAGDHLRPEDLNSITLLTDAAGLALDNTRLYLRLQESLASLNQAQGRLVQSEKLVALGEMAASIAHEIKNPLVSIGGFARRLHKKIPDDSREKTYSRIITKEIDRLEGIVNNVLSFTRPEDTGGYAEHDLNRLITDTTSLFTRELKRLAIELQLELTTQPNLVECDGNQIKQVLINLLNNSIQALSRREGEPGPNKQGFIRLRSATFQALSERTEHALIEIEDNGGGIPENVIHDIFNPFFTTRHDGTGLGLTICYRIIQNHQGEIQLNNRLGSGVKITITLPRKHHITGNSNHS